MPPLKSAGAAARAASRRRALPRPKRAPRKPAPSPFKIAPPPREADPFARPTGARLAYYAPEFLAEAKQRVEQTLQSTSAIARGFGIHHDVLARLIRRFGWVRPEGSLAANLSPAMRLAARADVLVSMSAHSRESGNPEPRAQKELGPRFRGDERAEKPAHNDTTIDRLEAAVLEELARVEAMQASPGNEPGRSADAARNARTLSILTETLAKLRRLRPALPQQGPSYDDMPADIDEFRDELARRIRALVASQIDEGDTGGDRAAVAGAPQP